MDDLSTLDREERLDLMRFVCSFAWADLEIAEGERNLVSKLVQELELDVNETQQVQEWLRFPPEVDPTEVPLEHRQLFLNVMTEMIKADGIVDEYEVETLRLFEQLVR